MHISRRTVSPRHLALYSIGTWAVLWLLSPFEYLTPVNVEPALTFVGYIIAFFYGATLFAKRRKPEAPKAQSPTPNAQEHPVHLFGRPATPEGGEIPEFAVEGSHDSVAQELISSPVPPAPWPHVPRHLRVAFWLLILLSAAGLLLRFYDLVVLKSYLQYESASAFRISRQPAYISGEEKGLISVVSSGLYPFAVITFICMIPYRRYLHKLQVWLSSLMLIPFVGYMALTGGRSYVITAMVMITIAFLISAGPSGLKLKFSSRKFAIGASVFAAVVIAVVGYSTYVLQERKALIGLSQQDAIEAFEADFHVAMREPIRTSIIREEPGSEPMVAAGLVSFYFVHGFYWFNDLYEFRADSEPTYGAVQYYLFARLLALPGFVPIETGDAVLESFPLPGVFYTFFGSVFVDWGILGGLAYCLLFGAVCQIFYNRAIAGYLSGLLVFPFLGSVVLHMMIVDMVAAGGGAFYLLDIILAGCIFVGLDLVGRPAPAEKKLFRLAF